MSSRSSTPYSSMHQFSGGSMSSKSSTLYSSMHQFSGGSMSSKSSTLSSHMHQFSGGSMSSKSSTLSSHMHQFGGSMSSKSSTLSSRMHQFSGGSMSSKSSTLSSSMHQFSGGSMSSKSSTLYSSMHQFSGGSMSSKSSTLSSRMHQFSDGSMSSKSSISSSRMHHYLQYDTQVDKDEQVISWISNAIPGVSGMEDIQGYKDHFTEEPIEEMSLEWDCSADEMYDITCHGNEVDGFYWADISKMHYPISPGHSFGDIGLNPYNQNQLLLQDQNSSSQRTVWVPFKENVPCGENSDDFLSTSSSSTDYFSCFGSNSDDKNRENLDDVLSTSSTNYFSCFDSYSDDKNRENLDVLSTSFSSTDYFTCSDSDEENKKEWCHFDVDIDFSNLHACVSDDEFIDFPGMQSMMNKQNNKSVTRYHLIRIPDMEYTLDDEFPKSVTEDAMPSCCQIFEPLKISEDTVLKPDVKSFEHSFENLIKTEEEECKVSSASKGKTNHSDLVVKSASQKRVKKNRRTNTEETISTFTIRCEEELSDDSFQIFRKLRENNMQKIFTKLELESQTNLSTLGAGQVMFNNTAMNFEKDNDKIIKRSHFLNVEEDIETGEDIDNGEMIMALALEDRQLEDKTSKLAIQLESITESRNQVYTMDEPLFPHSIPVQMKEKYCEQSEEHFDQAVPLPPLPFGNIDAIGAESASSNTEQQLEWGKQSQSVSVEDIQLKIHRECGIYTIAPSKMETSKVLREPALEWTHFPVAASNSISEMTTKKQGNNIFATLNEDSGIKHRVLKEKLVKLKPVENGSVRPPIQGSAHPPIQGEGRKKNIKCQVREKITPVEKVCSRTVRTWEKVRYHYSPVHSDKNIIKQDKQDRIVQSKSNSISGTKKEYCDDLRNSQRKPLVAVKTGNGHGFMDEKKLRDGNVARHIREEIRGTVAKYSKTIVEDGKIVYRNIKNWGRQSKVEKVCEFGSQSNILKITYRISQEGVTLTRRQQPA